MPHHSLLDPHLKLSGGVSRQRRLHGTHVKRRRVISSTCTNCAAEQVANACINVRLSKDESGSSCFPGLSNCPEGNETEVGNRRSSVAPLRAGFPGLPSIRPRSFSLPPVVGVCRHASLLSNSPPATSCCTPYGELSDTVRSISSSSRNITMAAKPSVPRSPDAVDGNVVPAVVIQNDIRHSSPDRHLTPHGLHRSLYSGCGVGCGGSVTLPNLIVMVGLPARGKTYISSRLARYLNWVGIRSKVFNLGQYRRNTAKGNLLNPQRADFFRPDNKEAMQIREKISDEALTDCKRYFDETLKQKGSEVVAIYDATNTTRNRRRKICTFCRENNIRVFFVESFCDNADFIRQNIMDVKVNGPDYRDTGMSTDDALNDFLARIRHYEAAYEPLDDKLDREMSFIRIFSADEKYLVNRIQGHIQSRVVYYLMNLHIFRKNEHIYLCRHGESEYNQLGLLGGNSELSERGWEFAKKLADFMEKEQKPNLYVWTSSLIRTQQTATFLKAPKEEWKCLDEIDAGICEELSYEQIQERCPAELAARDADKYHYRYPKGESYEDLIARLEPVIIELERQRDVLVIGHQAVLRCILGYFLNKNRNEIPYMKVPLHTVIKLTPLVNGCEMEQLPLHVDAVNTHRSKPAKISLHRSRDEALATTPGFNSVPAELRDGASILDDKSRHEMWIHSTGHSGQQYDEHGLSASPATSTTSSAAAAAVHHPHAMLTPAAAGDSSRER